MPQTIRFDTSSIRRQDAVALVYDLEGFSKFVNLPDVEPYVPRLINHVSAAVETIIYGGFTSWLDEDEKYEPLLRPAHTKFLGDGALYIWTATRANPIDLSFVTQLLSRFRNLTRNFAELMKGAHDKIPVAERPKRLRVGIARGAVYQLRRRDIKRTEYVGVCINFASKLQKYAPRISFTASGKLGVRSGVLEKHGFVRVIATAIPGFPRETVVLDEEEYKRLRTRVREEYFEEE